MIIVVPTSNFPILQFSSFRKRGDVRSASAGRRPAGFSAVQQKSFVRLTNERLCECFRFSRPYGEGDVFTLMSVLLSVLVEGAGDSFTIVVLLSFFSEGGLVTVVSFCSQAASSAAPMKRQISFFM